jgi:DNA-directed RNA polymerase specialized sigma24 family protein
LLAAVPSPDSLDSQALGLELQRHIFVSMAQQIRSEFQPNTWSAFWQTAVENHSVQIVADGLKMSVGSVYVARSRVMARLKQSVQEVMLEDELEVIELLKKMDTA